MLGNLKPAISPFYEFFHCRRFPQYMRKTVGRLQVMMGEYFKIVRQSKINRAKAKLLVKIN